MPYNRPLPQGGQLPQRTWKFDGFNLGVNTFSLLTELKGNELNSMVNMELIGKRSIRPRRGGSRLGSDLAGSQIDGLLQYKEGSSTNQILAIANGEMRKYNSSLSAWQTVSGASFTTGLRTRSTKLRSASYLGNGVDDFTKYDGTNLSTFTAIAAPIGLAVAQQGTTGTTAYDYAVTTITAKGESLPTSVVSITDGNETLDNTNFIRVTFTRKTDAQVIGYNVYGRKASGTGITLMRYIEQPTSGTTITFDDDGSITPQVWLPPDGDSTDGIKATIWEQLRGSLVAAGDPNQPHRFFFSGTGEKYESFSPAHNGGWADIRPGDNDTGITGLAPFESRIVIGKQNSVHSFYFSTSTGDAIIQELITYVGVGAPGSMVVMENDIAFIDSERKFRILGYEPNFQSSIRTTSLSEGRTQSLFDQIDQTYIDNCEAVYHKGRYLLACTASGATKNNMILAYDRRYLAFLGKWTGSNTHVGCWLVWDGLDNTRRLFAGASDSSTVFQFDVEEQLIDYDDTAVETLLRTGDIDHDSFGQKKLFKWADFRLYRITGTVKLKVIFDGSKTYDITEREFNSASITTGYGTVQYGTTQYGVSTGAGASVSDLDKPYRKELYQIANTLGFEISKTKAQTDFVLVSARGESLMLPEEVFDSDNFI